MNSPASSVGIVGALGGCQAARSVRGLVSGLVIVAACGPTFASPQAERGGAVPLPPIVGDIKTAPTTPPTKSPLDPERAAAQVSRDPLGPAAPAKSPAAPAPVAAPESMFDQVLYDAAADGSIWARGRTYKAQFAADGFTYVPFLGSDAPRNYPIVFALQGVSSGGAALPLPAGALTRVGDRITIDHGLVQEVYFLSPESVEQQFIFASRPAGDDVTISIALESDLIARDAGSVLRFETDLGGATYTRAVTIDALQRAVDSPTTLSDGRVIQIHLPAALVQSAAYPLTVDPIISTYVVANTVSSTAERTPDIAYDVSNDGYCVAWEHNFSAADGDVYSERRMFNGNLVAGSYAVIDSTSANWRRPRIANNNANNEYLIVGEVGVVGTRQVWSRWRSASSNVTGPATQVSDPAFAGDQFNADVGGDPWTGAGSTYYGVVWERTFSAVDHDILFRLVSPVTGATAGGVILIENSSGTLYTNPSISNSNNTIGWTMAYQYTFAPGDEDIYASQVSWSGAGITANFAIDDTVSDNINPSVSGLLSSAAYMVAYEENPATVADIFARVYVGNALSTGANLTTLENVATTAPRRRPSVDSNANHFVVTSAQEFTAVDLDPFVSTYCGGGVLHVAEQHRMLDFTSFNSPDIKVASAYGSGGTAANDFGVVWDMRGATGFGEIHGAYFAARASCCKTDIVSNNATDVADLLAVITGWGACANPSICAADINGDFTVNVGDLLSVIAGWGPCQ